MNDFFASIYGWICDSSSLVFKAMNVILGEDDELLFSGSFSTMGITAAAISLLVAVAFYIWPINHPRFKAWWSWLIMLVVNAGVNFGLTFAFISHRIAEINGNGDASEASEEAIAELTDENQNVLSIPFSQWLDLAWSNVFMSVMFFILASLIFTWYDGNCKYSPIRK